MALQNIIAEVAFTTTPFADPSTLTWTDVSASVLSWAVNRGRADEQSEMQAGTAQVVLDNPAGAFDPDNPGGAYYPNVLPGVPVRLSTTFLGTTYQLFYGFVEAWEQHYDNMVPTVNVTASDGLKAILAYSVGLGYTETVVQDYGFAIDAANANMWPWQLPNDFNYYLNANPADVSVAGISSITGIAQTGKQFSGSSSYLRFLTGSFFTGVDMWARIDAMPSAGAQNAILYSGGGTATSPCAFGYGDAPNALKGDDALSAWLVNYPQNQLAASVADPSSTTGWTASGGGATIASVAATTSNVLSRIWTDTGALDTYGATKVIKATMTSAAATTISSPFIPITFSNTYDFSVSYMTDQSTPSNVTLTIHGFNSSGSSVAVFSSSFSPTQNVPLQLLKSQVSFSSFSTVTQVKFEISTTSTVASWHAYLGQLSMWQGSYSFNQGTIWYAGGTAPSPQLLFVIASPESQAPPGQTSGSYGWPCYGTVTPPSVGTWFHLAADSGRDNGFGTSPYINGGRAMPSAWLNGVSVRLWTTAPNNVGWAGSPIASLGAKFVTYSSQTLQAGTSATVSIDECWLANSVGTPVDGTLALAHYNYGLSRHDFVQQLSGARVNAVLDSLGWPSAQRAIDTGTVTLLAQAADATGSGAAGTQLVQDATTAEGGLYFVGGDGKLNFWDQAHTMGGSPVLTIGDGSSDVHYMGWPVIVKDDTHVFNLIQLTQTITDNSGAAGVVVQVSDATSQSRYNVRSKAISAPWATDTDMAALAASILTDYKNPATRVSSIAVEGVTSNAFASLLARELGDYVKVNLLPANYTGPAVVVNAYLQGLSITGAPDRTWVFAFSLTQTIAGH